MFYAVDVCNRFSSLSVENIPVMESSQASNSTSIIATSGNIADDMSCSSSSTSLNTSSTTMDTLPDFINWPEEENQKMSSRAAKRQRRTQCKQVKSQTMVEVESDSSNRQHDLSSTTIQEVNKKSKLTKTPRQLLDNTATENQQQKDDIELDSSDDEVETGRSQGGSGLSSDDLDLAAEMMMHRSSNLEFKLATSGIKFDKQQERSQEGKQIIHDVQFNGSSSPINHSSSGAAGNQSLNQIASQQEIQQPQQPAMQKSRPSNPSPTSEPNDQYAMMANLKQQQPPPSSQQQAKDTDRIDAGQKFYSGDYNTIHQVVKDKEILGRDNREDDVFMPKDYTVILEDGKMNEIDRELEEFKRFCLMIKPLKNRPKVAVQVNLQDLAFRKT